MIRLGRYQLEKLIAAGGMAEVHLALDTSLERRVALKLPHRQQWLDPRARERFLQEARVIASLSHENIVHLYDMGEEEERLYLALEYVEGLPLDALLASHGPIPPLAACEALLQLLRGMAEAHRLGVLHRDIKPSNLLFTPSGQIKITDFGLSRWASAQPLSLTGQFLGTPRYASPELAHGDTLTDRSDLFSVGLVGLEMILGKPAVTAEEPQAALLQILEGRFLQPSQVASALPSVLLTLLSDLLQTQAELRPTAQGAVETLEAYALEFRLRLARTRVAHYYAHPEQARLDEAKELRALLEQEAKKAEAQGKAATAHKIRLKLSELPSGVSPVIPQAPSTHLPKVPQLKAVSKLEEPPRGRKPGLNALLGLIFIVILSWWFVHKFFRRVPPLAPSVTEVNPVTPLKPAASIPLPGPDSQPLPAALTTPSKTSTTSEIKAKKKPAKNPNKNSSGTAENSSPTDQNGHQNFSYFRILTRPPYAQVWVDGKLMGNTPTPWLAAYPGLHHFKLWRKGYDTLITPATLSADSVELRRELRPSP